MDVEGETTTVAQSNAHSVGGEEGEEEVLLHTVQYIHNGFILDYITTSSLSSATQMILELERCPTKDEKSIQGYLRALKNKRRKLSKNKKTDGGFFDAFLAQEFVFPRPDEERNPRCGFFFMKIKGKDLEDFVS